MDLFKVSEVIDVIQSWNAQELEFLYAYIYARLRRGVHGQITTLVFENVVEVASATEQQQPIVTPPAAPTQLEVKSGVHSAEALEGAERVEETVATEKKVNNEVEVVQEEEKTTTPLMVDEVAVVVVPVVAVVTTPVETEQQEKKTWAQLVATPPEGSSVGAEGAPVSGKKEKPVKESPSSSGARKGVKKDVPQEPKEQQKITGASWKNFCGSASCGCEYTFRDEDDPARTKRGAISGKTLFVRGWNRDDFEWMQVREAFGNALQGELRPLSTRVNTKGFAFLKFSSHKLATKAQQVLSGAKNFLASDPSVDGDDDKGVELIVNFAA